MQKKGMKTRKGESSRDGQVHEMNAGTKRNGRLNFLGLLKSLLGRGAAQQAVRHFALEPPGRGLLSFRTSMASF